MRRADGSKCVCQGTVVDDLMLSARSLRESQDNEGRLCVQPRRGADNHAFCSEGRFDLDLAAVVGDRILTGSGCGDELDREHGLGGSFADRSHEVPIQRELPPRVHRLKLEHDREELLYQLRGARRSRHMLLH